MGKFDIKQSTDGKGSKKISGFRRKPDIYMAFL
jgi:hypothetical protein